MSLSSLVTKVTYDGDGSTVDFPVTFPILTTSGTDIQVRVVDDVTPQPNITLLTSNYTYDNSTGMIHYPVTGGVSPLAPGVNAVPSGWKLIINRVEPLTQELVLTNQGVLDMPSIERAFDKLTYICQQLDEAMSRALVYDLGAIYQSILDTLAEIEQSVTDAESAAVAAAASESAAAVSESNATAEAAAALGSANAANGSAIAAAGSALSAGGSATAAANSALAASASAVAAAASAASAAALLGTADTYANLKLNQGVTPHFGWATDLKQLMYYTADAGVGDAGWIVIGG